MWTCDLAARSALVWFSAARLAGVTPAETRLARGMALVAQLAACVAWALLVASVAPASLISAATGGSGPDALVAGAMLTHICGCLVDATLATHAWSAFRETDPGPQPPPAQAAAAQAAGWQRARNQAARRESRLARMRAGLTSTDVGSASTTDTDSRPVSSTAPPPPPACGRLARDPAYAPLRRIHLRPAAACLWLSAVVELAALLAAASGTDNTRAVYISLVSMRTLLLRLGVRAINDSMLELCVAVAERRRMRAPLGHPAVQGPVDAAKA
nr:hypothetical protein HK105_002565 [Polyrhizophydium stewartii]